MDIGIEGGMRVKKIIVDELPSGCRDCLLHKTRPINRTIKITCFISDRIVINPNTRPKWCPLIVEDKD